MLDFKIKNLRYILSYTFWEVLKKLQQSKDMSRTKLIKT